MIAMLLSWHMIIDDLMEMENNLEFFSDFHPKNHLDHPCNFCSAFCPWLLEDWMLCGCGAHICSYKLLITKCSTLIPADMCCRTTQLVHADIQQAQLTTIPFLNLFLHPLCTGIYRSLQSHQLVSLSKLTFVESLLTAAHRSQDSPLPSLQWKPMI